MTKYKKYFGDAIDKFNEIVVSKKEKYPELDVEKIKTFLLTWTKHHLKKKGRNLKQALYFAIVTFETACNLAKDKLQEEKSNG